MIGTNSSNTGPGTIGVFTSLDSFATPVAQLSQIGQSFKYFILDLLSLPDATCDFTICLKEVGNTQATGSGETSNAGHFYCFGILVVLKLDYGLPSGRCKLLLFLLNSGFGGHIAEIVQMIPYSVVGQWCRNNNHCLLGYYGCFGQRGHC